MSNKQIRKLFVPVDGIERREDFPIWYEDGFEFCKVESDWESEKSRVRLNGPLGGMICQIKPDHKGLVYDVSVDRWTYTFKCFTIFQHYHIEGMLWQMYGTPSSGKAWFVNENTNKKDVYYYKVKDFKGHGPCYEIRVRDVSKLRPAAGALISMMIKEHHKGRSIGEHDPNESFFSKFKRSVNDTGWTYEELQERIAAGRNVIEIPEKYKK